MTENQKRAAWALLIGSVMEGADAIATKRGFNRTIALSLADKMEEIIKNQDKSPNSFADSKIDG